MKYYKMIIDMVITGVLFITSTYSSSLEGWNLPCFFSSVATPLKDVFHAINGKMHCRHILYGAIEISRLSISSQALHLNLRVIANNIGYASTTLNLSTTYTPSRSSSTNKDGRDVNADKMINIRFLFLSNLMIILAHHRAGYQHPYPTVRRH